MRESDGKVFAGSFTGELYVLEDKKNLQVCKKFVEAHGTLTDIDFTRDEKHMVVSSLDRHLRIYDLSGLEMIREEFLYQKLEKCLFSPAHFDFEADEIEGEIDEEEEEEAPKKGSHADVFRQKLEKRGGKLNHNVIKLKYEFRKNQ